MDGFAKWAIEHPWGYWIGAVLCGAVIGNIPGVGPVLFLAILVGAGAWRRQLRRRVGQLPGQTFVAQIPGSVQTGSQQAGPQQGAAGLGAVTASAEFGVLVPVVGTSHYGGWGRARGQQDVWLVREPRNEYDANAVAVKYGVAKIGHIPRERAAIVAPAMDQRSAAKLKAVGQFDAVSANVILPGFLFSELVPSAPVGAFAPVEPWGKAANRFEVEFERDHRAEIGQVFERHGVAPTADGVAVPDVEATLLPVGGGQSPAVLLGDLWVGNLVDPDAAEYASLVNSLAERGQRLAVRANVWALSDHGVLRANVRVLLPDLTEISPPGPMPSGTHVLLPRGRQIQVTGEDQYLTEVSALLGGKPEQDVVATLHMAAASRAKPRIEVKVYGDVVGQLTPAMSENFIPLVRLCDEEGVTVVCHAKVKGNQIKADVVLDTVKAGELSDQWIGEHVYASGPSFGDEASEPGRPQFAAPPREDMWTEDADGKRENL